MGHFHLYTDADGETHIEGYEPQLIPYPRSRVLPPHSQSEPIAVGRLVFFTFQEGTAGDWHTAPRRQFLVLQEGRLEITPSAGAAQTLESGDLVLIEDTTGKGHLTRTPGPGGASGVFVHLADEPQ